MEAAPVPHQVLSLSCCPAAHGGLCTLFPTATEREWSALRSLTPPKGAHQHFYTPGLQQADMFAASLRCEHLEKQTVLGKQIPAGRFTGAGKGQQEAWGRFSGRCDPQEEQTRQMRGVTWVCRGARRCLRPQGDPAQHRASYKGTAGPEALR